MKARVKVMSYDFNTASEQRSFDVIPDRTIAVVQLFGLTVLGALEETAFAGIAGANIEVSIAS